VPSGATLDGSTAAGLSEVEALAVWAVELPADAVAEVVSSPVAAAGKGDAASTLTGCTTSVPGSVGGVLLTLVGADPLLAELEGTLGTEGEVPFPLVPPDASVPPGVEPGEEEVVDEESSPELELVGAGLFDVPDDPVGPAESSSEEPLWSVVEPEGLPVVDGGEEESSPLSELVGGGLLDAPGDAAALEESSFSAESPWSVASDPPLVAGGEEGGTEWLPEEEPSVEESSLSWACVVDDPPGAASSDCALLGCEEARFSVASSEEADPESAEACPAWSCEEDRSSLSCWPSSCPAG
jgi:hypothetical protein